MPFRSATSAARSLTTTPATMTTPSLTLIEPRRSSGRTSGPRFERVPDAVGGADPVGSDLAAQLGDVRVDRAGTGVVVVAPHLAEQALAREHDPRAAREVQE